MKVWVSDRRVSAYNFDKKIVPSVPITELINMDGPIFTNLARLLPKE
jgi:hypothetical protein